MSQALSLKSVAINKGIKPKVLLVCLESGCWSNARALPYSLNFGFKEGLEANGVECLMVPSQLMGEKPASELPATSWLRHIERICEGKQFDQVWFEMVHSFLDEPFLEWMTKHIPIRLGFIYESLEISEEEYRGNPSGCQRRTANVAKHLSYATHIVVVDEHDVRKVQAATRKPVMWFAGGIVTRFICEQPPPVINPYAVFFGALYGKRREWLDHPELKDLLIRPKSSPEVGTGYPRLFDRLQALTQKKLSTENFIDHNELSRYLNALQPIREKTTALFLTGLQSGCAVVNLPQFARNYASRVMEGMAAGRPVIAAESPDCPRVKTLYEDGKEILLFSPDDPGQLASHIRRIHRDSEFLNGIAARSHQKLRSCYSMEFVVHQVLRWLEIGEEPVWGEKESSSWIEATGRATAVKRQFFRPLSMKKNVSALDQLCSAGLWSDGKPLRLHLGCGEKHLQGYINVDYPPSEHNVITPKAEVFCDIQELQLPDMTVDEVRTHHMFEHFPRVTALALLIRWHRWLKVGGKLRIETPDFEGTAKAFLGYTSMKVKMGLIRHLAGDQSASWGFHLDHWFSERFVHTLTKLGFETLEPKSSNWGHEPYLANIDVIGVKTKHISVSELLRRGDELLWESTVADSEKPTFEVWRKQLRKIVSEGTGPLFAVRKKSKSQVANHQTNSEFTQSILLQKLLTEKTANIPLVHIQGFNQHERDEWIRSKAATIPAGSRILDIGAGTCPYRNFFSHCDYKAHDFKKYEGVKLGNTKEYGQIDYISDIGSIPVPDHSFDVVLCSEVLEHVPEPIVALKEMARVLKPDGRLFLTAPLGSGLHQLPYHFYGGYTPEWYKHFGEKFGLEVVEIISNGGFFKLLAQECARAAAMLNQHLHGEHSSTIYQLFHEWLPRYLYGLDSQCFIDQFTVGYHVEMVLTPKSLAHVSEKEYLLQCLWKNHRDPSVFVRLAQHEIKESNARKARQYLRAAVALDPKHSEANRLLASVPM